MDFVQIDPGELSLIALLMVVGGLIGWRFLGLFDGGLRYIADALREFNTSIQQGSQIDEKQTQIITELDKHIRNQATRLDRTTQVMRSLGQQIDQLSANEVQEMASMRGHLTEGLSQTQEILLMELKPLTERLMAIEASIDELPAALRETLRETVQADFSDLLTKLEAILDERGSHKPEQIS